MSRDGWVNETECSLGISMPGAIDLTGDRGSEFVILTLKLESRRIEEGDLWMRIRGWYWDNDEKRHELFRTGWQVQFFDGLTEDLGSTVPAALGEWDRDERTGALVNPAAGKDSFNIAEASRGLYERLCASEMLPWDHYVSTNERLENLSADEYEALMQRTLTWGD